MYIVVHSSGNDVAGYVTDVTVDAYRKIKNDLKRRGFIESFKAASREHIFKSTNYAITFYGIPGTREDQVIVTDIMMEIFDRKVINID